MKLRDTNYSTIESMMKLDVDLMIEKGKSYGPSWKQRGGVGAFMMMARKWDRIENMARERDYDVFRLGTMEDIQDLICYLYLVREHMAAKDRAIDDGVTYPYEEIHQQSK